MSSPTVGALTGFIAWTLFLLVLMEGIPSKLVFTGTLLANGCTPDNAKLSRFMQRLARAQANCQNDCPSWEASSSLRWQPAVHLSPTRARLCCSVHESPIPASAWPCSARPR